jgi:MoaA/NifB/PqqE/SkfB family radical SAM enzyme
VSISDWKKKRKNSFPDKAMAFFSQVNRRCQLWAWRQIVAMRTHLHELNYFFWETTRRCNLTCRHCGSDCTRDETSVELPADRVIQVFENIAEHRDPKKVMVAVTGGEPLMRSDLFYIMEAVHQLGFRWGMVTNGMLMNERMVNRCIAAGMGTVVVSLDGDQKTHNWLRNHPDSYRKAIRALKLLSEADAFSIVEAITCVNPQNINQLDTLYDTVCQLNLQAWRLFTIFPRGRAESDSELFLNRDQFIKLFRFIEKKRTDDQSRTITYFEEGFLGCRWEGAIRDFCYCSAGINTGGLLCDGSFSACPSLGPEWIQGHIDDSAFMDIWNSKYQNMRNRKWMQQVSRPPVFDLKILVPIPR